MVFETLDWIVILLYFGIIAGLAWWVTRQQQETSSDYFLAGRHLGWFIVSGAVCRERLRCSGGNATRNLHLGDLRCLPRWLQPDARRHARAGARRDGIALDRA